MILKILIVAAVVLIVLLVVVALRSPDFRITRSATISAPPARVFAQVNDLHHWEAWSPWLKLDPAAKQTYDGAPAGTGAGYTWDGNNKVGAGRMTITESHPSDLIKIKLEFIRPFPGTNAVEFTFKPQGDQTVVTWSMSGKYNFMMKAFSLFMDCDKMIGGQFETGLAQMKSVVETAAR